MTPDFSRISKTNQENLVEYLQRQFLNYPASFFLQETTNRQIDLLFWVLRYSALAKNFFLNLPKFKSVADYIQNVRLSLVSNNLLVYNLKVFIVNRSYLRHFWYLEGSWLNVIPSFCHTDYSLVHFMWYYVTFGYLAKM